MSAGGYAQLADTPTTANLRDPMRLAGVRHDSCRPDFVLTTSLTVPFAVTRTGS